MTQEHRPPLREIFQTWFTFGIQSFGGGSPTFYLIHQACMKRRWMSEVEFSRTWALAQVSPGINLVKLTALIGYKLRGWPGLIMAMCGLLLPSGAVTVLMTAGFSVIRSQPMVQAAMRGILPATIGLSLATAIRMSRPLLQHAREEGRGRLGAHIVVAAGASVLMATGKLSPVVILLLAGIATLLLLMAVPMAGRPAINQGTP
jgi:chromate transporter